MPARGQVDVLAHRLERLPAAGVGDGQRAGLVDAVDRDVEFAVRAGRRDACLEGVRAGGCDVDGVLEPLASLGPADDVPAAGVGRGCDVDALRRTIGLAQVGDVDIVIRKPFAAFVEVLGLDRRRPRAHRER